MDKPSNESTEDKKAKAKTAEPRHGRFHSLRRRSTVATIAGLIVALGIGIIIGASYQKHQTTRRLDNFAAARGGRPGMMEHSGRRGMVGTVTAVSSTGITVKDVGSNETQTLAINSNTRVTKQMNDAKVSDIKTGDKVLLRASNDGKTASRIVINPSAPTGRHGGRSANDSVDSQIQTN